MRLRTGLALPAAGLLAACNRAPSEWPDASVAPGAEAPWAHPTNEQCDERDDSNAFEVDGFTFCGAREARNKIAVDDPIYTACADLRDEIEGDLLAVFDGVRARGWSVRQLEGREIVNDDWDGEPILVDY